MRSRSGEPLHRWSPFGSSRGSASLPGAAGCGGRDSRSQLLGLDTAYELGRQVRQLREPHGLSQRELAERMDTTQSVIARLEAGGSKPSISTLERVARATGSSLDVRFQKRAATG